MHTLRVVSPVSYPTQCTRKFVAFITKQYQQQLLIIMACDCDYMLERDAVAEKHYFDCVSKNTGIRLRNPDGTLLLSNKHLNTMESDFLYHFNIDTASDDLQALFGDVKFVCMGGKDQRMVEFAEYISEVLGVEIEKKPWTEKVKNAGRYVMFKVGPVLSISHGMGIPSMSIAIQEIVKLLYYAKAKDPIFFRLGSSGGVNVTPGTVVISSFGLNGVLEKSYDIPILGVVQKFSSTLDKRLAEELWTLSKDVESVIAGTMGTDDFYRGQARLDGPYCDYEEADKMKFLMKLKDMGVRNIEMEAPAFAALTASAGVRSAILCATFLDRLKGDQVTASAEMRAEWEQRPMVMVGRLIKHYVDKNAKK